jgi:regulator of nonsense transcripts 2
VKSGTAKSDIKKAAALVKKIKTSLCAKDVGSIVSEINSINLSRYLEELVASIVESKVKISEHAAVVAVVQELHVKYGDFGGGLLDRYALVLKFKDVHAKDDPKECQRIRRTAARVYCDLVACGIADTPAHHKVLLRYVSAVTGAPEGDALSSGAPHAVTDAQGVLGLCKTLGVDVLFNASPAPSAPSATTYIVPRSVLTSDPDALAKLEVTDPSHRAVDDKTGSAIVTHLLCALKSLQQNLLTNHTKLHNLKKRASSDRVLAGKLSDEREANLKNAESVVDNLLKITEQMCDALNVDNVVLPVLDDAEETAVKTGLSVFNAKDCGGDGDDIGPFDDVATYEFYCKVTNFLPAVPLAILGIEKEDYEKIEKDNETKYGGWEEGELNDDDVASDGKDGKDDGKDYKPSADGDGDGDGDGDNKVDEDGNAIDDTTSIHYKLYVFLDAELPSTTGRETTDKLCETFIINHGTNKKSRARLAKTLHSVSRTRLDLLPLYSRFLACLDRVIKDVAPVVVDELSREFNYFLRNNAKRSYMTEARQRNIRFIAELTKFRVAPPIVAIKCLQGCLRDFEGYNIDVCCTLLENCGRFLYKLKASSKKIVAILEHVEKIKKNKAMDPRHLACIKSALSYVIPPEKVKKVEKVLPEQEQYVRWLLLTHLSTENHSYVAKQLAMLPWRDNNTAAMVVKWMVKSCYKGRYSSFLSIPSVVKSLKLSRPEVCVRLVDRLCENLLRGLEAPSFRDQVRMTGYCRMLGELFGKGLVNRQVVLDVLYGFLDYGHKIPDSLRASSTALAAQQAAAPPQQPAAAPVTGGGEEDEEVEEAWPAQIGVSPHSKYDPRVPTPLDHPGSCIRAKFTVILIDSAASELTLPKHLPKLKKVLINLQRYLFCKPVVNADVEFAVLDLYDKLDSLVRRKSNPFGASNVKEAASPFVRFTTWKDSHEAVIKIEAMDAVETKEGAKEAEEELVEEEESEEEEEEEEVEPQDVSVEVDEEDESSDEGSSSSESESSDDSDEEKEEEIDPEVLHQQYLQKLEEEAFEQEMRRMTMDYIDRGKAVSTNKLSESMVHSRNFGSVKKAAAEGEGEASSGGGGGGNMMAMKLLKRGHKGKVETTEFVVPNNTTLAASAVRTDNNSAIEKEELKRRVIKYADEAASANNGAGVYGLAEERLRKNTNQSRRLESDEIDKQFGDKRPVGGGDAGGRGAGRGGDGGRGGGQGRGGGRGVSGRVLKLF